MSTVIIFQKNKDIISVYKTFSIYNLYCKSINKCRTFIWNNSLKEGTDVKRSNVYISEMLLGWIKGYLFWITMVGRHKDVDLFLDVKRLVIWTFSPTNGIDLESSCSLYIKAKTSVFIFLSSKKNNCLNTAIS